MTSSELCDLHRVHHPSVAVTKKWWRFPAHLQFRVYEGELRSDDTVQVCGTGEDNLGACVGYLLGEAGEPQAKIGTQTWQLAQEGVALYHRALREAHAHRG